MLTSSKKNETAVQGCNPTVSVLVVLVSHKVYFLCSTISLAVLFVMIIYHFHADQIPCWILQLQHFRLRSLALICAFTYFLDRRSFQIRYAAFLFSMVVSMRFNVRSGRAIHIKDNSLCETSS